MAEKHIQQRLQQEAKKAQDKEAAPVELEDMPDLSQLDFASRRMFDSLASHKMEEGDTLLELAEKHGVPMKINSKTVWYNFRQLNFSRTRKRQEGGRARKYTQDSITSRALQLQR